MSPTLQWQCQQGKRNHAGKRAMNKLLLQAATKTFTLYPETKNTFCVKESDRSFEFLLESPNRPQSLTTRETGAVVAQAKARQ